jgi:alpha-L-fucosidase 2
MATLWYRKPAELDHNGWEEDALPLGNAQLGCKVFGGISKERIQLNEKSLWSGTVLGVSGNTNGNGNGDFGKSFS